MKKPTLAEQIKKSFPNKNVFEVTVKRVYMTDIDATKTIVKDEWFGTHINRSHAYRDAMLIGGGDELISVKEITLPTE